VLFRCSKKNIPTFSTASVKSYDTLVGMAFIGYQVCIPGGRTGYSVPGSKVDAFAKNHEMASQKFRSTRFGGFSGVKAYISSVKVLKNHRNAVGRSFCDAIKVAFIRVVMAVFCGRWFYQMFLA